jgi:hypothetical protein
MMEAIVALGREVRIVIGPERFTARPAGSGRVEVIQH